MGARLEHPPTLSASRPREIAFRQPDGDGRRWPGLAGLIAGQPRDGSFPQCAHSLGLIEAVCNEVLTFCPPLGFLSLALDARRFPVCHNGL